jgi:hypothetical protein
MGTHNHRYNPLDAGKSFNENTNPNWKEIDADDESEVESDADDESEDN